MSVAIVTDSNSGITQEKAKELGIAVLPMPFYIDGELYYEGVTLTQEEFYQKLGDDAEISTSQPSPGDLMFLWGDLLDRYDEVVHIPMSSGLSGSCQAAMVLSDDYDGRVFVVDNQRISVTQYGSVIEALALAKEGKSGAEIKDYLEETKHDSSIYITLDTLKYLKKGGRITAAAAAFGTVLGLKPVLQIQGEKLDAYKQARGMRQAKATMIDAMKKDLTERFADLVAEGKIMMAISYSGNIEEAEIWKQELKEAFPGFEFHMDPLSLSVACHIGNGALAVACCKKK